MIRQGNYEYWTGTSFKQAISETDVRNVKGMNGENEAMNTVGLFTSQFSMALYCSILLKVYLDVFLVGKNKWISILGWLLFFGWQFCTNMKMIFFTPGMNLAILFVTVQAVGVFSYEGGYWKRCIFPIAFIVVWMLLEGSVQLFYMFLRGSEAPFGVISVLSKALLAPYVMAVRSAIRRHGGGHIPYTGSPYMIVTLLFVMVLYNAFYMQTIDITEKGIGWLLIATVVLIFLTLSFYVAYLRVVEMVLVKRNNSMYTKQFKLYKREWELEEIAALEVREMRHDMKQQYMYLRELANSDQKEELIGVLEKLIGESAGKGRLESRTGNLVIDAHVNHLWEQSRQKNIALYTDLKVPPAMNILDEDLSVLLGNAVDNALEASEFVDDNRREIRIQMTFEKGYLFISLKNRYQGEIKQDERNRLITSKKEKALHGLGLSSMKKIASKYHGYLEVRWEDNIFMLETILYENT